MGEYIRKSREERYEEIRSAALKVFLEKGYRNTTMEDIINATSLSKGGFYHYYRSTKQILIDIMRYGNYRFIEQNIKLKENASREEVCMALTNIMLDKVLNEAPERELYLMFAYEIIYDKDFEKVFLELEKETLDIFDNIFKDNTSNCESEKLRNKNIYISRMGNALLLTQNLFSDKEILKKNRENLYNIFYRLYSEILE
ncbi:MAG: TetR/AcrR family transcriptional regulator [Maledivibacter sp.]|jgi:AcrR family transcriptional regulator|nr:TetR/AcrR family transcriptional regulator [Maledivibacter sp.]